MNNHVSVKAMNWFLAPIDSALSKAINTRMCPQLTDSDFIKYGIMKVLLEGKSGRDFVQKMRMTYLATNLSVSLFFKSLGSARREKLTCEVAEELRQIVDAKILGTPGADPLEQHPELKGYAVYASDGHTHSASAHEPFRFGKKYPVTHIYSINLRTHTSVHNVLLKPEENKKKEHEVKALKRMEIKAMRMNEPIGTKVIHIYDPAITDYDQGYKWKQGSGIYVITMEKSNAVWKSRSNQFFDKEDKRNNGIISDEKVCSTNGFTMRRIEYRDPVTCKIYLFLTNVMTLPPGLIAFLYFLRWNIEKMFDEFKNSLDEKKAWTGQESGKIQQAQFMSMTHNLMLLAEHELKYEHNIVDEKVQDLLLMEEKTQQTGREFNSLVAGCQRATKRSLQFIRWLRHCLAPSTLLDEALALLPPLMREYLA